MQFDDLRQIRTDYDHVYLSPHLDDAALSCGGRIAHQHAAGEKVLVITICTAVPPAEGPFNALAEELHAAWALSPGEAVSARLREDELAMERLGADRFWAGRLDAIYRRPGAYDSRAALFGQPAPDDSMGRDLAQLFATLRSRMPHATFYAPLGVGSHVDHLIVQASALTSARAPLAFYEEPPYVLKPGALEARLATLPEHSPEILAIDATIKQKIHAVAAYASQLDELFGGFEAMAQQLMEYAASVRPADAQYGERLWRR
jgi:LmbE family N-acetylglucosaminyl deacetylase